MYIVTAQEMYDIEAHAMQTIGIPSIVLMENAGRAIVEALEDLLVKRPSIAVVIGPGNNGGDGWVVARLLHDRGLRITAIQTVPDELITGDASINKQIYEQLAGPISFAATDIELAKALTGTDLIIDALLGIGMKGKVRKPYSGLIRAMNQSQVDIVSIDIPSGLAATEDAEVGNVVQATLTLMLGACKISAFLPNTAHFFGEWRQLEIGIPSISYTVSENRKLAQKDEVLATLPKRDRFSHKGSHGKSLIVGGSEFMPGSISMTAMAALRTGSGLCTIATDPNVIPVIAAHCLEATFMDVSSLMGTDLSAYDGIAIGPGMGRGEQAGSVVRDLFKRDSCTLVIDADGLFHVKDLLHSFKRNQPTLLTPHPGEMAMLLGIDITELLSKPFTYSKRFAEETGAYVLLKGKYTIITAPDGRQSVNNTGNEGLAKGGSGDVLTGIVLVLAMQQEDPFEALRNACYMHGLSADLQVQSNHSVQDLLASDVVDGLRAVYRHLL